MCGVYICTVLLHAKKDIIHTTYSNVAAVLVLVVVVKVKFPGQIAARNIRNLRDYLTILQRSISYVYALTT